MGEFQQLVLLAVLRVRRDGEDAYGINVHEELEAHAKRRISRGAVYLTLDRLEKKGLLESLLTDPTPERGGRGKRCYALTQPAIVALQASQRTLQSLWEGLDLAE